MGSILSKTSQQTLINRLGEDERAALAEAAAAEERQAASLARLFIREGLKARGLLK